jgi:hypothetical protein
MFVRDYQNVTAVCGSVDPMLDTLGDTFTLTLADTPSHSVTRSRHLFEFKRHSLTLGDAP